MSVDNRRGQGTLFAPDRFYQPIDFSGIRIGNILPSDIDLICECGEKFTVEFRNKAWIFIELKYRNAEFTKGQDLTYKRLVDDLSKLKPAISIVAEHSVDDPKKAIDAAVCTIRQFYYRSIWHTCKNPTTLKSFLNWFISKV